MTEKELLKELKKARKENAKAQKEAQKEAQIILDDAFKVLIASLGAKLEPVAAHYSSQWATSNKPDSNDKALLAKFTDECRKEANILKMEPFGIDLLHLIGEVYSECANYHINAKVSFLGKVGLSKRREPPGRDGAIRDAQNSVAVFQEIDSEDDDTLPEQRDARRKRYTDAAIDAVWAGAKIPIMATFHNVATDSLKDKKLDKTQRLARARAMLILGSVFSEAVRTPEEDQEVRGFTDVVVAIAGDIALCDD